MLLVDWTDPLSAAWAQAIAGAATVILALLLAGAARLRRYLDESKQATARASRLTMPRALQYRDGRWTVPLVVHGDGIFFEIMLESVRDIEILDNQGNATGGWLPNWVAPSGQLVKLADFVSSTGLPAPIDPVSEARGTHVMGLFTVRAVATITYTDMDGRAFRRSGNARPESLGPLDRRRNRSDIEADRANYLRAVQEWRRQQIPMERARLNALSVSAFIRYKGPAFGSLPDLVDMEKQERILILVNASPFPVTNIEVLWETNEMMHGHRDFVRIFTRFRDQYGLNWQSSSAGLHLLDQRWAIRDLGEFDKGMPVCWKADSIEPDTTMVIPQDEAVRCNWPW